MGCASCFNLDHAPSVPSWGDVPSWGSVPSSGDVPFAHQAEREAERAAAEAEAARAAAASSKQQQLAKKARPNDAADTTYLVLLPHLFVLFGRWG
jgi:hypothetical protein